MAEMTEKVTINLSPVDLGKMDLLVDEGFFANRTDFVKDAIRRGLDAHESILQEKMTRNAAVIGLIHYNRRDLEQLRDRGEELNLTVVGLLDIAADVDAELAAAVFKSCKIMGVVRAAPDVKAVLSRKGGGQAGFGGSR